MSKNEYINRYREQRRLRGLCIFCGQKRNTGKWRCDVCSRKEREWQRQHWKARNPLYCRECKKLIKPEERIGGRFHKACAKRRRARTYPQQHRSAALAYQRRHREKGLCTKCPENAFKAGVCKKHYGIERKRNLEKRVS